MDGDIVEDAITYAKLALGVERLKEKQEEAIKTFVKGRDCFVILPTGYGKTLCYVLLPYVFDRLRKKERTCIVLCVSPFTDISSSPKRSRFLALKFPVLTKRNIYP